MNERAQPLPSVVIPGNHDGVHRGHLTLLQRGIDRAAALGVRSVALFFDPHPAQVLAPERAPATLTTVERRKELLRQAGVDEAIAHPFDRRYASLSPEAFVEEILVGELAARSVVVGPDFRFGAGRAGDAQTLATLGKTHGFTVEAIDEVELAGARASSTRLRQLIAEGALEEVPEILGRLHDCDGLVVRGDQRGRQIGFPTANLATSPVLLPADGVYAIVARRLDHRGEAILHGVANLGLRPTFDAGRSVEAHLFDFDREIYGERLRIGFVKRLRGEIRFDGLDALVAQIERDAAEARVILSRLREELVAWI